MSDCLFCKIAAGDLPCKKLYEDDEILVFHDIHPAAPVHFLTIPKKHITNLMELEVSDSALAGKLLYRAQEVAKELGCDEKGGRFVINAKSDGRQTIHHLHIHFVGGRPLDWSIG